MKIIFTVVVIFFYSLFLKAQTWTELQKITATDRQASDHYSKSVSINGNYAVVGSHRQSYDENGANYLQYAGAVYVYENQLGIWTETQKLVASDRNAQDDFGTAVSISGNTMLVGSYKRDETINSTYLYQCGAVYVFTKNLSGNWIETQKLLASDLDSLNYFGKSVDVDGNYAIIGAAFKNEINTTLDTVIQAGAVYIFEKNLSGNWVEVQKLTAPDKQDFDVFGWDVSISGDYAVVGAYQQDTDTLGLNIKTNAGAVYVFKRNSSGVWIYEQKIIASDRTPNDLFGYALAISNDKMVVGAYQNDKDGNNTNQLSNAGAAYIYERNANGVWIESSKLVASDRNTEDWFGYDVGIKENNIIVGARQQDFDNNSTTMISNAGAAYIFSKTNNTWQQIQKVTPLDRTQEDWFGFSVDIDTTLFIAGAFSDTQDANGQNLLTDAGSAYIFENSMITTVNQIVNSSITIFPNPVFDELELKLKNSTIDLVELYDINGRLIKKIIPYNSKIRIDFQGLASGLFLIKVISGKEVFQKKIVKY